MIVWSKNRYLQNKYLRESINYFCYLTLFDNNSSTISQENISQRMPGFYSCTGYGTKSGKVIALIYQCDISTPDVRMYMIDTPDTSQDTRVTINGVYDYVTPL